jgi:hypothetical protein
VDAIYTARGGVRAGGVNATWPFAKLTASPSQLKLATLIGTYEFAPNEVVSLETYGVIPVFSRGVRIAHARADYPSKIIFWYLGSPDSVIDGVRGSGFLPNAPASAEVKWRGLAIRWMAVIPFILIWNALFLPLELFKNPRLAPALIPLVSAIAICWAIRKSPRVQNLVMKRGRSVEEISAYLSGIQTVCGILSVVFAIISIVQAFK